MQEIRVNAVFQGGGMKAIGLAGAVEAAERKGIRFAGLAGTSSGSIVASMLAAGYTAAEMKEIILSMPFSRFLRKSFLHRMEIIGPVIRLYWKKGLYPGDALEEWVGELLRNKGIRSFGDLPPGKLKIIASDISLGRLLVLPDDIARYGMDPQRFRVARAIRMSTSIPYFFEPVVLRYRRKKVFIVDGGILSNFPLWLFDRQAMPELPESKQQGKYRLPTLGFHLVGKAEAVPHEIIGPFTMFRAIIATMMEAHDERYIEMKNRFRTIKVPALGVKTTEFDLSRERALALYEAGKQAGQKFFADWSPGTYQVMYEKYASPVKV